MVIDLMRQFYDEERIFRITGEQGQNLYVPFSAAALRPAPARTVAGVELGSREPVFDITISAAKKSTFSRMTQNETAKECYQLGFFNPANADAALAALEMMDFEGIEKVRQRVRQNGTLARRLQMAQQQLARLARPAIQGPGPGSGPAARKGAPRAPAGMPRPAGPADAAKRAMNSNGRRKQG